MCAPATALHDVLAACTMRDALVVADKCAADGRRRYAGMVGPHACSVQQCVGCGVPLEGYLKVNSPRSIAQP